MKLVNTLPALALILSFAVNAQASSHYQICHNSDGSVSVENGNVTLKDGNLQLGPAKMQKEIHQLSRKDERCVDGPNYLTTIETVEKVSYYSTEEGSAVSQFVVCQTTLTGIMAPGSRCK
jgi:hypothetical protein